MKFETIFPDDQISEVEHQLGDSALDVCRSIRGHFLASAVSRFILKHAQSLGKKVSLSNDALYTTAITHFGKNIEIPNDHYGYYVQAANRAVATY